MSGSTRIAVTGWGAVTPLGADADETWRRMLAGESGVRRLEQDWAADLPVRIAGTAPSVEDLIPVREQRRLDRAEQLAMVAGREAWAMADAAGSDRDRTAVVIGSAIGGLWTTIEQQHRLEEGGPRRVSPHTVTMMMANGAAAWLSMAIGARAGARAPVSACASGSEAVLNAREMILAGTADVVVAGGTEACVTPLTLSALAQTRALSRREDDPARASRPFDRDRDGFVLGEGAAVLVLEREETARARGATVHAWLEGAAVTSDAYDIVAADPENQARTMRIALASAGMTGRDVGFVHAHATSTPLGDLNESRAIREAVGTHVAVTATKSMTGHLLGASGALGALATVRALEDGLIPPTANFETPDPELDIDVVASAPRPSDAAAALVNAFGFGGHNVSLVLSRA
ncbi:MAG TPA: beta-ketoacyl-[acyl-carrier-protein] synthase family protein [Amnibacterium sp.]|nr:beta-ketoacyl-[acyl-carrier-protein] synthase family protein [Amnibacterium sp.]